MTNEYLILNIQSFATVRLQHESKPDAIETLDRTIITMKIEVGALRKETDPNSRRFLVQSSAS